jgi:hypothetical protein
VIASKCPEELYAVITDGEDTVKNHILAALEIGTQYLDVSVDFVTSITDGEQKVVITA